ncbi:MAG TPA: cyclopropane fatty acyl phospholipid synthase [Dokdonella sp.]|uniref:cyclopropane fatty acyl phospholipid synthase n=1 Tax=Dokdonella sp. TaxID=2291710 RepID=UPI002D7E368C|nr:cyclopropane fatty acyl phospholipid synthase [Dokdonella sp.]HET9031562.1 cyclopropane fatty acyl phospholipid synthase [Dokdonella sp.]
MPRASLKNRVISLLADCGIEVGGDAPWDIRIHDEEFYARVIAHGSLGLGESYMDEQWDAVQLDAFLFKLLNAHIDERTGKIDDARLWLKAEFRNLQRGRRAYEVGERHYDLGNDLFRAMLGKRLVYSCGYWKSAGDLDAAQEAKLDLVCRKLGLVPGMRVLDIGCGWGEALKLAAERYGISGVGVTVSNEQAEFARELCRGLPIEIRVQDYRELDEQFDRVFSIGMFEHVGVKNYRRYFEVVRRCLIDDGLTLLHCIGANTSSNHTDPWIAKYIFPNSMIPSAAQISKAAEKNFVLEDWHGFGPYYDRTLMAWMQNFEQSWPQLSARYGERFRRMWHYYLAASAAAFRSRRDQLWQIVFSPRGVPGGYVAQR